MVAAGGRGRDTIFVKPEAMGHDLEDVCSVSCRGGCAVPGTDLECLGNVLHAADLDEVLFLLPGLNHHSVAAELSAKGANAGTATVALTSMGIMRSVQIGPGTDMGSPSTGVASEREPAKRKDSLRKDIVAGYGDLDRRIARVWSSERWLL